MPTEEELEQRINEQLDREDVSDVLSLNKRLNESIERKRKNDPLGMAGRSVPDR